QLQFTTGTPQIGVAPGCGTVTPAACVNPGFGASGSPCGTNADCTSPEFCMGSIDCGGLYFGGAGVSVPLPSVVPDMGQSITNVASCDAGTGSFTITAASDTDTGSNRNCTAAGVTNPEYPGLPGCLFGPPLPVPNANASATSTCVINRIVSSATGTGSCTGDSSINFNLASDLYL